MDSDAKLWSFHQTANIRLLNRSQPRQDMIYGRIRRSIDSGKVLEIGFGDGYLLQRLSDHYECYGADISKENIAQVKKWAPKVKYKLVDTDGRLPYKDNTFEGFIASEVFEHTYDEELKVYIAEMYRVLKPGGYAFLTFPAEENFQNNSCFCPNCGTEFHRWGHKQYWDRKNIQERFKKFEIKTITEFVVPYIGKNLFERVVGYVMWLARTIINKFNKLEYRSYLVILQKPV